MIRAVPRGSVTAPVPELTPKSTYSPPMYTLNPQDQIVATICLNEHDRVVKILPGNACVRAHLEGEFNTFDYISILITERMLVEMNSMERAKWARAKTKLEEDIRKRSTPGSDLAAADENHALRNNGGPFVGPDLGKLPF